MHSVITYNSFNAVQCSAMQCNPQFPNDMQLLGYMFFFSFIFYLLHLWQSLIRFKFCCYILILFSLCVISFYASFSFLFFVFLFLLCFIVLLFVFFFDNYVFLIVFLFFFFVFFILFILCCLFSSSKHIFLCNLI